MECDLQIGKMQNELEIRARVYHAKAISFVAFAGLLASLALLATSLPSAARFPVSATIAVFVFFVLLFVPNQRWLTVTKFAFASNAWRRVGRGTRRTTVVINTPDVCWLEYRDGRKFVFSGIEAAGLYAAKKSGAECLPSLDFEQSQVVIREIESAFPGLAEMWWHNFEVSGKQVVQSH
jgi:hypothetical protein